MKTIREVCKLVGVTRRTLQEYDRIGLLSPANKDSRTSSNDAWLYSDKDIWKLIQIQTLVATGMKRMEIKELLKDPEFKMGQTLLLATKRLKEEKRRLDLLTANLNKLAAVFPDSKYEEVDPEFLFLTHSFLEYLDSDGLVFVRFTAADSPAE
ncbi:MAG: MerR family transcriptional regulator [Eubacterium sp.]|nr:MerR family transcriptional regulator [Eubacterium sp.]